MAPGLPTPADVRSDTTVPLRRTLAVGVLAVLILTLLGVPLGLLWRVLAPSVPVVRVEDGAVLADSQPEQFIASDGWFSLLGLAFGVLAAIAVWLVLRAQRGPVGLLVLSLGGLGAAVVAWQLGSQVGLAGYQRLLETAAVGQVLHKPPELRAGGVERLYGIIPMVQGDLLLPAFGAVVMYTLLAGWSRYATLRPETEPTPVSWAPVAPPTPTGAPAPPAPDAAAPPPD